MRIAILGTGGTGAYFGGRLAQGGHEVIFLARGRHLQALQASGLRVDSINGDFIIPQVMATDDPSGLEPVEAALVAVKTWQLPEALHLLAPLVGPQTLVIPVLNGVEAPAQLAAGIQTGHVLGGLCRISSYIAGPGYIRHTAIEPYIAFAPLQADPVVQEKAEQLRQAFELAGVKADVPANIWQAMWQKFVFIAPVSGVGAVVRAPMGVFRSLPETRRILIQAIEEVVVVGNRQGADLPLDQVSRTLAYIDSTPYATMASMQRDILEGWPSELEAQNGAVVRLGAQVGADVPVNSFIYASLLPMEHKARGQADF